MPSQASIAPNTGSDAFLHHNRGDARHDLYEQFSRVRSATEQLVQELSPEDMAVQSMPDASPAKWHLAHTSWFFETFILQKYQPEFSWFDASFCYLFNSYYESVGERYARPQRGLLTRPSSAQVMAYRQHIDQAMQKLIAAAGEEVFEALTDLVTIGLHHEMQHQELISTDILHLFSCNPTFPALFEASRCQHRLQQPLSYAHLSYTYFSGGLVDVGISPAKTEFAYDCETPRHTVFLQPFSMANRLVTNGEWLQFMADDGYANSLLWLSDGWHKAQKEKWQAPLYWIQKDDVWHQFGLDGLQVIEASAPVCHISFYEADAYARWAGKRLPREHEWEHAASQVSIQGNFLEQPYSRPQAALGQALSQLYGEVWEWTQSAFSPYPGFKAEQGALGEYNGKFMASQFVLKGGSCMTPSLQMRSSYRNFFYPHHRWQFTGLRLADDA